jgi:hypothetical protein
MSEKTVVTEIPEEFKKVIGDFISDISNTFPEYLPIINRWWKTKEDLSTEEEIVADRKQKIDAIFGHCVNVFPERFFDILYQNVEIFKEDSVVNTEFLPGVSFKYLWNCDISDKTKETIWKYLQLILLSIIGCVKDQSAFGDTAKLFESINEDEFKDKLQETLEKMQNLFEKGETSEGEKTETPGASEGMNMPSADEIHSHINGMLGGKLGDLAREIAEETAGNLNIDMDNVTDVKGVFQNLFKNPGKLMNLVKNVGDKLDTKIKSGEINQSELMAEASEIMNKMKDMPGMGDIQSMLGKMGMGGMGGMGGLGKNARVDTNAMKMQMDKYSKMEQMKERIRKKAEKNKQAKNEVPQHQPPVTKTYSEQELKEFLDSVEKGEKTPREVKPKTTTGGKKKKGKK